MNTFDAPKQEEFLKNLKLSGHNREIALAYLQNEYADEELLKSVQPEDFLQLTMKQRVEAMAYLRSVRRDRDLMARIYRLFWAMGKASAEFVLTDLSSTQLRREPLEWCVEVLGTVGAAALEAHYFTWMTFDISHNPWLSELARTQPEVLEEVQAQSAETDIRLALTLAGILLGNTGDEAVIRRQKEILHNANLSCLRDMGHSDQAEYVGLGDPSGAVPAVAAVGSVGAGLTITADAQLIGLAGTASFLAAPRDDRAKCALQVYARLNPDALLARLLRAVPDELLLRELDHLTDALPDGQTQLLLYLARRPLPADVNTLIARKCRDGLEKALEAAGADQYVMLRKMFPQQFSDGAPEMEDRIIRVFCDEFMAQRNAMDAFLRDRHDLSQVAEELEPFPVRAYGYLGGAHQLLTEYRIQNGWNDFLCRCGAVIGLLMEGRGIWLLICPSYPKFEEGLLQMCVAMLERKMPVKELLNICATIPTYVYDGVPKKIESVLRQLVVKPAYLEELAIAAREGGIVARQTAVNALHELSRRPECAEDVRRALLACTADSSKQVREQLQSILSAHPEWAQDYMDLLKSKKAAERLLAVGILANLGEQMRPVLEEALAAEKSSKVADAIQNILGQGAITQAAGGDLVERVLKGNKIRKVQWLLDPPLPELHRTADRSPVSEDHRAAILVAYSELGRIGRSDTAAELAGDIEASDLTTLAHEVFERWMSAGAQARTKWVLPFAAVFGGAPMTPKLIRAINDWPQHARGAIACDAVTALALSTDPAALLAVDAISRKFKFRQVKTAAAAALDNAARELGITTEELADRIVPDLGFGADGRRVFDYGNRSFTVSLTPTLELEITNHLGRKVKNLPAPGKTDDEARAAEAYEAFKTMKKQIRTTVTTQKARLEAALSVLRCWKSDAWKALFVRNPIMHQFAISLIWGVYEDGKLTQTFRYMEDGSFNTVDEDEYELPEDASIGLVHPIDLDADTLEGWKQQLEDYEITQSIQQLDRPVYAAEATGSSLERFGGRMLNGLSLSGKLLGMGWYRGSVQDGGMYNTYYREDPSLGMAVELHFSGAFVGDENDTVTVYDAVFYKAGTVKRGSYVYDEPKESDIYAVESIPARYYSEIVHQLERATASSAEKNEDWKKER